ncbi:hypothetical protein [Bradyrhizobium sp. LB11.1]|uniref:hypothetical protein n=1 Tax=Bradyrhizobium sp. LB11.1 TaxID=3156326 RepID=UPI003397EDC3
MNRSSLGILAVVPFSLYSLTAVAQDWDHLPDGRVIIEIKNKKLAFPSVGFDVDHVRFDEDSLQDRATLREVIASPNKAREIFRRRRNVGVSIWVAPNESRFLNQFDRAGIQNLYLWFNVGEDQQLCRLTTEEFNHVGAAQRRKPQSGSSPWEVSRIKDTLFYSYVGPELKLAWPGLKDISCNSLSYCGVNICLTPELSFSYGFGSKAIAQDRWVELSRQVDAILSNIVGESSKDKGGGRDFRNHGSINDQRHQDRLQQSAVVSSLRPCLSGDYRYDGHRGGGGAIDIDIAIIGR